MEFKEFFLNEADLAGTPPTAMPPPVPPPGGAAMPPGGAPPGPPMGGGMGGMPGGDLGGMPPMGGAAATPAKPQIPFDMKNADIWSLLKHLLNGKISNEKGNKLESKPTPESKKFLMR